MTKRPASPQSSPVAARSRLRPASPQSAPVPPAAPSAADPTFKMLYVLAIIMIVDGHVGSSDYLDFNGLLRYQNYHIALSRAISSTLRAAIRNFSPARPCACSCRFIFGTRLTAPCAGI